MHPDAQQQIEREEQYRGALVLIGRLAEACRSDMNGRLQDDEHWRAYRVLGAIKDHVHNVFGTISERHNALDNFEELSRDRDANIKT